MKTILFIFLGICLVVLVMFYILGKLSQKGNALGLKAGKLAPCPSKPNCVCSEDGTRDGAHTKAFSADQWDALKSEIAELGGTVTQENDRYFAAEFRSNTFKFVDDFEARLDGDNLHIRSASRVGYSDRGVNKKRVAAIRSALSARG